MLGNVRFSHTFSPTSLRSTSTAHAGDPHVAPLDHQVLGAPLQPLTLGRRTSRRFNTVPHHLQPDPDLECSTPIYPARAQDSGCNPNRPGRVPSAQRRASDLAYTDRWLNPSRPSPLIINKINQNINSARRANRDQSLVDFQSIAWSRYSA